MQNLLADFILIFKEKIIHLMGRIMMSNRWEIYENCYKKFNQCYLTTFIFQLTPLSSKKKHKDKHFHVKKKVIRLLQLVIRFVQKLSVYCNW